MLTVIVKTPTQEKYNLDALGKVSEGYVGENGERCAYVDVPRYGVSTVLTQDEAVALAKALLEVARRFVEIIEDLFWMGVSQPVLGSEEIARKGGTMEPVRGKSAATLRGNTLRRTEP